LQNKEGQHRRDSHTRVEPRGKNVVVLRPPREVTPANDVLEDKPDDRPGRVVDSGGGGYETSTTEDDGEVDEAYPGVGPLFIERPSNDRGDSADEEKQAERLVDLAHRELASRADDPPDDGGSPEDLGTRAGELVLLRVGAHTLNVAEHPGLNGELDSTSEGGADDLTEEHGTGRDLHIVTELEVRRKGESLSHSNVSPGLEHHHRDRTTRESVPDDELGDDVQPDLLVRDSLNHADGDHIEERDDECEDEPWYRELGVPDEDTDKTGGEHGDEDDRVPPLGNLLVTGHETGMNIWLFVHRPASLLPNLLAVVQEAVAEGGSD